MLSICLLGQPYWIERLGASLVEHAAGDVRISILAPHARGIAGSLGMATGADILIRVGFRPGAPTSRGRLLDAFCSALRTVNRRARMVYYWIGSDVMQTVRDVRVGTIRQGPFERAKIDSHLAEATWLAEELNGVGIHAKAMRLPVTVLRAERDLPLPDRFTVLTHVPDFRFRFYGGECVYEAARTLPQVQFEVVAGNGPWIPAPLPNLRFHGWQSDMTPWYGRSSVVVRMVEHDGLGLTIQEALSFGRHAVYTYPVPHTHRVQFGDVAGLKSCLGELLRQHELHKLQPNAAGWEYATREFNEAADVKSLMRYLTGVQTHAIG